MTDNRFRIHGIWSKWALVLLLLVQSVTFSGFSDISPSRDSGTRNEWLATFSIQWRKTVSYRQADRLKTFVPKEHTLFFESFLNRQNNRYLTWLATVCAPRTDEPKRFIPVAAWPRSADEAHRS